MAKIIPLLFDISKNNRKIEHIGSNKRKLTQINKETKLDEI